jgi:hypothetical protein
MLDVLDQALQLHSEPATLPLSARQQEGQQMETVLLASEFAVSRNIFKYLMLFLFCLGLITTNSCGSTISTNTSYIRNPK